VSYALTDPADNVNWV